MRRFRRRRRRVAALALLALAATTMTSTAASETAPPTARIDSSARKVRIGDSIMLRGQFPGAAHAAVQIRFRPNRAHAWRKAGHTRTGASGRYRVRVRPHGSGTWRARLATDAVTQVASAGGSTQPATAIDTESGGERVAVRSRTVAKVARDARAGNSVHVRGHVAPAGSRRRVVVRIGDHQEVTKAGRDGRFDITYEPGSTGIYAVRAHARANRDATASSDRAGKLTVYRPAAASWYGPGLYGNALACGGTLTPGTLGVANRTLPCGTKVRLKYGSRTVTVPVIDRGPFAGNREYDLTAATKQALGFPDVGTVLTSR